MRLFKRNPDRKPLWRFPVDFLLGILDKLLVKSGLLNCCIIASPTLYLAYAAWNGDDLRRMPGVLLGIVISIIMALVPIVWVLSCIPRPRPTRPPAD